MNQKLLVRVLLGVLALLLVAGMVVQFTPALSSLRGSRAKGTPALKVNGEAVTTQALDRARQGSPIFGLAQDGTLGLDLKTVLVYSQVQSTVLQQAVKDVDVSRAEIAKEVQSLRDSRGLKSNKDYTAFLQSNNLTDAQVRDLFRTQLAQQKKVKQIQDGAAKPTDAEVRSYYDLNADTFRTEPRIVGREIVVADQKKANALLAQLKGGADFEQLARANSAENKDRGGALGPVKDGKVQPVAAAALPADVAAAAFALTGGGLTNVVKSGSNFYLVKVEQFLPAGTKTFADAKSEAQKTVLQRKQNAAVEAWFNNLMKGAKVEVVDKSWAWYNPGVASVAGQSVPYAELLTATLSNQQVGSLLQSQPAEQAGTFLDSFFKPQVLDSLIQQYAAPSIVQNLKLPLTGTRAELQQALLSYGGRNAKVTDADVAAAYTERKAEYSTPASASVSEASFDGQAAAQAFQSSFVKAGGDFTAAASKAGGTVAELGTLKAGESDPNTQQPKLDPAVNAALFEGNKLQSAGEGSVSGVLKVGSRFVVAYARDLVRASTKPLAEVQGELRDQLLTTKRQQAGQTFVQAQLKKVKVQNHLQQVLATEKKQVAQSESAAKPSAPKSGTTNGTTGTSTDKKGATPNAGTPNSDK